MSKSTALAKIRALAAPLKTDERGWLVETRGVVSPCWWRAEGAGQGQWTRDAERALRFARREDAEAFITFGLGGPSTGVFATEHMWPEVETDTEALPSDGDLVSRVVLSPPTIRRTARWAAVRDAFMVGSGTARRLCRRFGLNEDEELRSNRR